VTGVLELAPVSPLTQRQQALIEALLPAAAANAEILTGNIATRSLLEQTRLQAATLAASERQLAARKEELEAINEAMTAWADETIGFRAAYYRGQVGQRAGVPPDSFRSTICPFKWLI